MIGMCVKCVCMQMICMYKCQNRLSLVASNYYVVIIQTEAERRRREAGVKQSMEIRVR